MYSNPKKFDLIEKYLNITEKVSFIFLNIKNTLIKVISFMHKKKSPIMLSLSFMSFLLITLIFICSCHIGSFIDNKSKEDIIHQQGPLPPPPPSVMKTQKPEKGIKEFYVQENLISIEKGK